MRLYTRQHINVVDIIEKKGRFVSNGEYISSDMPEHKSIILDMYTWLSTNIPNRKNKPLDAKFPIWLNNKEEAINLPTDDTRLIVIDIDDSYVQEINISKWGMILNYMYIPLDDKDLKEHYKKLDAYGISDTKAYMSNFYPDLKNEIRNSWHRLFDNNILPDKNPLNYYLIWEIKKEWIIQTKP